MRNPGTLNIREEVTVARRRAGKARQARLNPVRDEARRLAALVDLGPNASRIDIARAIAPQVIAYARLLRLPVLTGSDPVRTILGWLP